MGAHFEKYLAAVVQAAPVYGEETVLYSEIDPESILREKWKVDTNGQYSRNDIVRLVVNGKMML